MTLANMSIKNKLIAGFGVMALLVMIVSTMSLRALGWATDGFSGFVDGVNARADVASQFRTAVDRRAIAARNLVLVTKQDDVSLERAAAEQAQGDVMARLKQLDDMVTKANDTSDKAKALVAEMNRIEALYSPVALKIVGLAVAGKHEEAVTMLDDECRPLLAALVGATDAYATYTREVQRERVAEYEAQFVIQRNLQIALSLAAIALATLACWFITRSITRPIDRAVRVAQTVAAGDLTTTIVATSTDETGVLLRALGEMNDHLRDTVGRVRNSANSIGTATREIAAGNHDLSVRTEEQAASLEETAASMDQLTHVVQQNAENAQQATSLASTASEIATKGGDLVDRMVQTMQDIERSSAKIADITGMIEGIAFQTNILALNAAVEAARAGEEGRGFAVVAGEVRNLAQRSASAAKEIKELISTSVVQVQQGSSLVGEAGGTMHEVQQAIGRVSVLMADIAAASGEQGRGIEQVNEAVSVMDQVTQQNAALVEEAAAASESLKQQGRELTDAVAFFIVEAGQRSMDAVGTHDGGTHREPPARPRKPARGAPRARPASTPTRFPSPAGAPAMARVSQEQWSTF
ncbi:methyl-accepting chemotaxis protein [Robbsia sp. KACC 23696]|uniref:methyl-accepting chemotaxis protein n=1 Tax=Robbsia sp. KACC 23696 TaxID=3149231 RepID=UPI00325B31B5